MVVWAVSVTAPKSTSQDRLLPLSAGHTPPWKSHLKAALPAQTPPLIPWLPLNLLLIFCTRPAQRHSCPRRLTLLEPKNQTPLSLMPEIQPVTKFYSFSLKALESKG